MTQKDKATLATDMATALANNTSGDITPTVLRSVLTDYLDSLVSLSDDGAFQDWTPTLDAVTTAPDLGTSPVQEGRYCQIGDLVTFRAQIKFGTSPSAGSGTYILVPPVTARLPSSAPGSGGWMVGRFAYFDAATGTNYGGGLSGDFNGASGDIFNMAFGADSPGVTFGSGNLFVTHAVPFTPTVGCEFELWGSYEAA